MKYEFLFMLLICAVCSCKEPTKETKPMLMGDTSMIVTENDERFLQNHTEDISPSTKKTAEGKITSMMKQVDSAKSAEKMAEAPVQTQVRGFTINFAECEVIFENLSAHAIQNTQNERSSNSVSYLKDAGDLFEINLQVIGLEDVKVEERTFTRLSVKDGEDEFLLNDLGKFISPWSVLTGNENQFVSLGSNSLQFFPVDNAKIKKALDRELRKAKKSRKEIQQWMTTIKKINVYSDSPCTLKLVSAQWRIKGKKDGKNVQKLIQFDIPD